MTTAAPTERARREIEHGRMLAAGDTEAIWGWTSPAGWVRAKRRAAMIIEAARIGPGKRIMEVGCGTGMFTEFFAATGAEVVAVDISPELIAEARKRDLPTDRVRLLEGRFEDFDAPESFDAVVGSSVLHHLEVEVSLRKMFELLRPGGAIAFAEPNYLNPQVFLERKFHRLPIFDYVSPDETAFVRWPLRRLLESIGFVEPRLVPHDWLHPSTPQALIPAIRTLGTVLEHTPLLRELSGSHLIAARRPDR